MTTSRSRDHLAALAAKRDTETFQRLRRSDPTTPRWDDDDPDPEASTYLLADERGPTPTPAWLLTEDATRQHELGLLKTGKEADVHLVERRLGDRVNVLAAKRYRAFDERMFRDDSTSRSARRTGNSRTDRAMEHGSRVGMAMRAHQWLRTEFDSLCTLWHAGAAVPYPVQRLGPELLVELIGTADAPAPRLVHAHLDRSELAAAWEQLVEAVRTMTGLGIVHGDLSPYNILWHEGRLVIIDLPQAVDPIAHPAGLELLRRDAVNVATWFSRAGMPADGEALYADLLTEVL